MRDWACLVLNKPRPWVATPIINLAERNHALGPNIIALRLMQKHEFEAFLGYFIPAYANEISENYGLNETAARSRATQEVESDLPTGPDTPNHYLSCIVNARRPDSLIGYLWYSVNPRDTIAFIYDFHVLPSYQGKGYGKAALALLESDLDKEGIREIRLRVAASNGRARKLYESVGFVTNGYNMNKRMA